MKFFDLKGEIALTTGVERLIILITGASGSGKTTVLKTLESMIPVGQVAMHYFDSLGVPSLEEMIEQFVGDQGGYHLIQA